MCSRCCGRVVGYWYIEIVFRFGVGVELECVGRGEGGVGMMIIMNKKY